MKPKQISRLMRAFTLVEVMVVIAIIAILAAMAVPSMYESVIRKQIVESRPLADLGKKGVTAFYALYAKMPADNAAAGLPEAKKIISSFVTEVNVDDGAVTLTYGNNSNKALVGKRLTLRPAIVKDTPQVPISWLCGFKPVPNGMSETGRNLTDIPVAWLPFDCRG